MDVPNTVFIEFERNIRSWNETRRYPQEVEYIRKDIFIDELNKANCHISRLSLELERKEESNGDKNS